MVLVSKLLYSILHILRVIWTFSKSVRLRENVVPLGRYSVGKAREPILGPKTWCPRLGQLSSSLSLTQYKAYGTRKVDLA